MSEKAMQEPQQLPEKVIISDSESLHNQSFSSGSEVFDEIQPIQPIKKI